MKEEDILTLGLIIGAIVGGVLVFIFMSEDQCQETYSDFCERYNLEYDKRFNQQTQCLSYINGIVYEYPIVRIDSEIYFLGAEQ